MSKPRRCPTDARHPDSGVPCTRHGWTDKLTTPQIAHGHVSDGHETWWSKGYKGKKARSGR